MPAGSVGARPALGAASRALAQAQHLGFRVVLLPWELWRRSVSCLLALLVHAASLLGAPPAGYVPVSLVRGARGACPGPQRHWPEGTRARGHPDPRAPDPGCWSASAGCGHAPRGRRPRARERERGRDATPRVARWRNPRRSETRRRPYSG